MQVARVAYQIDVNLIYQNSDRQRCRKKMFREFCRQWNSFFICEKEKIL